MQLMGLASAVEVELWKELMRLARAEVKLQMHFEVTVCNCSIFDEMGGFELSNSQGRSRQQGSQNPYYPEFVGKVQSVRNHSMIMRVRIILEEVVEQVKPDFLHVQILPQFPSYNRMVKVHPSHQCPEKQFRLLILIRPWGRSLWIDGIYD
ncbi:hypothetical protein A2U01_0032139 [Trifolium medium]|uniref:Uncharacterized protein n=1 Tax=Trifolium medium TaxID=97028 RepID=A0A392PHS1_9FABA|nr:hypothetical protein [Trifolium medium]